MHPGFITDTNLMETARYARRISSETTSEAEESLSRFFKKHQQMRFDISQLPQPR